MKIAFLCSGFSENEAMGVILRNVVRVPYRTLKNYREEPPDEDMQLKIYFHRYTEDGKLWNEYLRLSKFLIDDKKFEKFFVWCDAKDPKRVPVCEFAREQYARIAKEGYAGKIELLLAVKTLENWYFSNPHIFEKFIGKKAQEFPQNANVDTLNAKKLLHKYKQGTPIEHFNKQQMAARFFSCVELNQQYQSGSLSRFLLKLSTFFSGYTQTS